MLLWKTEPNSLAYKVFQLIIVILHTWTSKGEQTNQVQWTTWVIKVTWVNHPMESIQIQVSPHQWWIHLKWHNYHMYQGNMDPRNHIHSKMISDSKEDFHQSLNKLTIVVESILMLLEIQKSILVKTAASAWNMDISMTQMLMEKDLMQLPKWTLHHKVMFLHKITVLPTVIKL